MKLAGILLLSCVPILFFFWLGEEAGQKQKMRSGILLLLEHLLFQIENFDRDQKEIFSRFENHALEKIGFLESLGAQIEEDPCGALGRVMALYLPSFSFSKDAEDALRVFSDHFGLQSKSTQIKELSLVIGLLREEEKKQKSETDNKIRILRMTGITAGLGIMILLI